MKRKQHDETLKSEPVKRTLSGAWGNAWGCLKTLATCGRGFTRANRVSLKTVKLPCHWRVKADRFVAFGYNGYRFAGPLRVFQAA